MNVVRHFMRAFPKFILIIAIFFLSCNNKHKAENKIVKPNKTNVDTLRQYDLDDSSKLTLIKDLFYKSNSGHLYQRTIAQVINYDYPDSLMWKEYFNGTIRQDLDPEMFEQLDGWYAKDKNFIYYYRPVSGGMLISKIDTADINTFRLLAGHYKYAMDKNFFYDEPQIIDGFIPSKTNLKLDKKGRVIEMTYSNKTYKFELVD